ncbi:Transmembrane protein adipocyte-associated 1-like protein [Armadillidium vulgare]|nr:Transmembrane protein adipocyte-associated 1-like protein [Armadillidium vulgare]
MFFHIITKAKCVIRLWENFEWEILIFLKGSPLWVVLSGHGEHPLLRNIGGIESLIFLSIEDLKRFYKFEKLLNGGLKDRTYSAYIFYDTDQIAAARALLRVLGAANSTGKSCGRVNEGINKIGLTIPGHCKILPYEKLCISLAYRSITVLVFDITSFFRFMELLLYTLKLEHSFLTFPYVFTFNIFIDLWRVYTSGGTSCPYGISYRPQTPSLCHLRERLSSNRRPQEAYKSTYWRKPTMFYM